LDDSNVVESAGRLVCNVIVITIATPEMFRLTWNLPLVVSGFSTTGGDHKAFFSEKLMM